MLDVNISVNIYINNNNNNIIIILLLTKLLYYLYIIWVTQFWVFDLIILYIYIYIYNLMIKWLQFHCPNDQINQW